MSDPGVTYRTRDEIQNVRQTRDSVNYIGHVLVQNGIMDEKQWKVDLRESYDGQDFQNDIKKQVKGWVTDCLKESPPAESELLTDILYGETPDFIRGIEYVNSKTTKPLLYQSCLQEQQLITLVFSTNTQKGKMLQIHKMYVRKELRRSTNEMIPIGIS